MNEVVSLRAHDLAGMAPVGLVATDRDWRIVASNTEVERLTGYAESDLLGSSFGVLLTPAGRALHQMGYASVISASGRAAEVAFDVVTRGGDRLPVFLATRAVTVEEQTGGVAYLTAISTASERRGYERDLQAARREAEASRHYLAQLHAITRRIGDAGSAGEVADAVVEHLLGLGFERPALWLHDEPDGRLVDAAGEPADVSPVDVDPADVRHVIEADGRVLGVVTHAPAAAHERDPDRLLEALLAAATRSLERLALMWRLEHEAHTDSLTGLANRRGFDRVLVAVLEAQRRDPRPSGLFYLDLDGFKAVNDRAGHEAGDQILRDVATALTTSVRGTDVIARLGGDEFAVLTRDLSDPEETSRLARRLHDVVAAATPAHTVTASIGAVHLAARAVLPSPEQLLVTADAAMYRAKAVAAGEPRVCLEVL